MDSILTSVKKTVGLEDDYTCFDPDIIMHINSVLSVLTQLGVGSPDGFSIEDKNALWTDFLPNDPRLGFVKSYVQARVRLMFDPPVSSAVTESIKNTIAELEWRITIAAENKEEIQNVDT